MQLGASYEAQGLKENANQQYQAAHRIQNNYIPAIIAQGNLAFERGDLKTAETRYHRVLHLEPNHAGAHNNLAMIYLTRGEKLDEAERHLEAALKQEGPLRPYALETLASLYIQQGRVSEARSVLEEADAVASSDNPALCEQLSKTREKLESGHSELNHIFSE